MDTPALDKSRPFGDIFGSDGPSNETPRFYQDGHYFRADGKYLSSDAVSRREAPPVEEVNVPTTSTITDKAEIDELLSDPDAERLLNLDREVLVEMVKQAGGPVLSGDDSTRMMAAWLLKYQSVDVSIGGGVPEVA